MTLDDVVQMLAERVRSPLVLYDAEFNLIAYSAHGDDADEPRRSIILQRRGSTRAREMMQAHGVHHATTPVRLPAIAGVPARRACPVRHDGLVRGYLVYVEREERDLLQEELDLFAFHGAQVAELLTVRELERRQSQNEVRFLLEGLVSDDASRRAAAAASITGAKLLPPAPPYIAIVATSGGGEPGSAQLRLSLENTLQEIMSAANRAGAGAVIGPEVVAVLGGPSPVTSLRRRFARGHRDVALGCGAPQTSLQTVAESLRQARIAARAVAVDKDSYGTIAEWDELGLDRLLLQLPLSTLVADDLPTQVRLLLNPAAGPDLAKTVEAYLDSGCDAQETARRLNIHRSTLYYRLDRVREVTGSDLHDGRVRRDLHTGLRVARLAGLDGHDTLS